MSKIRFARGFALIALLFGLGVLAAFSQPPNKKKPSQDPTEKPINAKSENVAIR